MTFRLFFCSYPVVMQNVIQCAKVDYFSAVHVLKNFTNVNRFLLNGICSQNGKSSNVISERKEVKPADHFVWSRLVVKQDMLQVFKGVEIRRRGVCHSDYFICSYFVIQRVKVDHFGAIHVLKNFTKVKRFFFVWSHLVVKQDMGQSRPLWNCLCFENLYLYNFQPFFSWKVSAVNEANLL